MVSEVYDAPDRLRNVGLPWSRVQEAFNRAEVGLRHAGGYLHLKEGKATAGPFCNNVDLGIFRTPMGQMPSTVGQSQGLLKFLMDKTVEDCAQRCRIGADVKTVRRLVARRDGAAGIEEVQLRPMNSSLDG